MTTYDVIFGVLADKLNEKDTEISVLKWKVEDLEKKLAEAEYFLTPSPENAKKLKNIKGE